MNYQKVNKYILITCLFALVACNPNPKNGAVGDAKMMDVLYDIYLAQAIASSSDIEPKIPQGVLTRSVLEKHNLTQEEFDISLTWYADNMKKFKDVNDSVTNRLQRNSQNLNKLRDLERELIALAINSDEKLCTLYNLNTFASNFRFTLDSTRIRDEKLLDFEWSFDVQGLEEGQKLKSGIYYTYQDTVIEYRQDLDENIAYSFSKPTMPDSLLKSISGYIHLKKAEITPETHIRVYNISYCDSLK